MTKSFADIQISKIKSLIDSTYFIDSEVIVKKKSTSEDLTDIDFYIQKNLEIPYSTIRDKRILKKIRSGEKRATFVKINASLGLNFEFATQEPANMIYTDIQKSLTKYNAVMADPSTQTIRPET